MLFVEVEFEAAVGGCFYRGRKKGCVGEGLGIGGLDLLPDLEDRRIDVYAVADIRA